jgi:hypothetical protein
MNRTIYVIDWQKKHKIQKRFHMLKWYYRNRTIVNALFSRGIYVNQTVEP